MCCILETCAAFVRYECILPKSCLYFCDPIIRCCLSHVCLLTAFVSTCLLDTAQVPLCLYACHCNTLFLMSSTRCRLFQVRELRSKNHEVHQLRSLVCYTIMQRDRDRVTVLDTEISIVIDQTALGLGCAGVPLCRSHGFSYELP